MSQKVTTAIQRLNTIFPLQKNQQTLNKSIRDLHQAVLRSYVEQGRSLNRAEMANYVDDFNEAVTILKQNDLVVFDNKGEPIGAYPFTMEQRKHQVTVNNHTVHCMCALDALAVSPMFNLPTHISTRCEVSSIPISINQHGKEMRSSDQRLFFGINWNAASTAACCADSLCTEMIFLAGDEIANNWLTENSDQREIFTLQQAVNFAAGFFMPLLSE